PHWAEQGQPVPYLDFARRFRRAGDLRKHPAWEQGCFVIQEQGAALCALALGARPGERVFDACAGRGQKASLLADRLGPGGSLWVSDKSPAKLTRLVGEFERLGLPRPSIHVVGQAPGSLPTDFD